MTVYCTLNFHYVVNRFKKKGEICEQICLLSQSALAIRNWLYLVRIVFSWDCFSMYLIITVLPIVWWIKDFRSTLFKTIAVVKVVMWSRGGLSWRSQVGANPIPIPHPTNLALFGHKITLYRFNQGAHTIAGGLIFGAGSWAPWPLHLDNRYENTWINRAPSSNRVSFSRDIIRPLEWQLRAE